MPRYSSFEEYCAHLTEHNQELIISIDEYILTNFTEIGRSIKWNCPFYTLNSLKDGYIGYLNVSKSKEENPHISPIPGTSIFTCCINEL
jgi:hypothetical protein